MPTYGGMRILRVALMCSPPIAAATLVSGAALAKSSKPAAAPSNLRGFLLRPNESVTHVFPRTPAFAWTPVRGAVCYEFEPETSRNFTENAIVWSNVRYGIKPGAGCKAVAASSASDTASSASTGSTAAPATPAGRPARRAPPPRIPQSHP